MEWDNYVDTALMAPGLLMIIGSGYLPGSLRGTVFVVGIVVLLGSDTIAPVLETAREAVYNYLIATVRSWYDYGTSPRVQFKYRHIVDQWRNPDGSESVVIRCEKPFVKHPRLGAVETLGLILQGDFNKRVVKPSNKVVEKGMVIETHAGDNVTLYEIPYHSVNDKSGGKWSGTPWYWLVEATGDYRAFAEKTLAIAA